MRRGVGWGLIIGFSVALLFIIGNAVVSFRAANTLMRNYESVERSQEAVNAVEDAFSIVKDAETGQRGYLLTGRDVFLEPYNNAIRNVDDQTARLRELFQEDPVRLERINDFDNAIDVRLGTLSRVIGIYQNGGLAAVDRLGLFDEGRKQMDTIRNLADTIRREEEGRLIERRREVAASSRNSVLTFLAANLIVLALFGLVYYLVKRDTAAREAAEEELREAHEALEIKVRERTADLAAANTELERSNRELQDFAFVASHDLQEPLRKIQAFGDRLRTVQGPKFDDQGRDYLNRMHSAAGRMHTLINDLLTFSRVTTKAQPFRPTDLAEIAEDVMTDLEVRVQQTEGSVEIDPLPTIDADPLQMRQLFQNLIGNSLKFHREGEPPRITIRSVVKRIEVEDAEGTREMCSIMFTDNGIGFDEKYLDRIFTPFQRLHGRGEYEGTGIGLAVCRKIVERHSGTLTAESVPGKGSTFFVTLPVRHEEQGGE